MTNTTTRAVLVPVKDLTQAKSRLARLLTLEERRELAWVLLCGVLDAVTAAGTSAQDSPRRVVVTNYPPAIERARALGFEVIEEREQRSESASVDTASARLEQSGVRGVLRIPLDLPLLSAQDVSALLDALPPQDDTAAAVLVPSRDRLGTNALYRSPPTLFASSFGPDSLMIHARSCRDAGTEPVELEILGFGLDVDDPNDVAELLRRGRPCPALDYLHTLDIEGRLARMAREPA